MKDSLVCNCTLESLPPSNGPIRNGMRMIVVVVGVKGCVVFKEIGRLGISNFVSWNSTRIILYSLRKCTALFENGIMSFPSRTVHLTRELLVTGLPYPRACWRYLE